MGSGTGRCKACLNSIFIQKEITSESDGINQIVNTHLYFLISNAYQWNHGKTLTDLAAQTNTRLSKFIFISTHEAASSKNISA